VEGHLWVERLLEELKLAARLLVALKLELDPVDPALPSEVLVYLLVVPAWLLEVPAYLLVVQVCSWAERV
jgi:hypothetical protein